MDHALRLSFLLLRSISFVSLEIRDRLALLLRLMKSPRDSFLPKALISRISHNTSLPPQKFDLRSQILILFLGANVLFL